MEGKRAKTPSPLFPAPPPPDPMDEIVPSNIRLVRRLWLRLERIAKLERKSRAAVIARFLEWAADEYDRVMDPEKRSKK